MTSRTRHIIASFWAKYPISTPTPGAAPAAMRRLAAGDMTIARQRGNMAAAAR